MSRRPRNERNERSGSPIDSVLNARARSPSIGFDGSATWSPSNFRKTLDLTKTHARPSVSSPKLDKLFEDGSKSPIQFPTLVGSKDFADVVFHVGNHALYAHRCVIEARCPPLFAVAVKDRGRKGAGLTTIKSDEKLVDIRSLSLVLEYLYTGSVPFPEVSPAEVISLIAHCELYQIDRLRWLCERYLQAVLTDDLFFTLLLVSDVSGVARAKTLCMAYGTTNFEKLITKKDQVATLGIELFREFVVFATLNSEVLEDLSQLSFPNTIRDEFKIIYTAMANPDAFFSFKSANTTIPCHRAILFAQSDKFKALFLDEANQGPHEARYTLPKHLMMPADAFKAFLSWAYYRDTSFSAEHAAMMLPLAHDFGITTLVDECDSKIRKGISVNSVIPILVLCFSEWGKKSYKQELAQPCLDFLILNFTRVDLSTPRSAAINAAIAEAVRNAVISGLWQPIDGAHTSGSSPDTQSSQPQVSTAESEIVDSDADAEKKYKKKKNRKTTELDLNGSAGEDSITESTGTPKTGRRVKVTPESAHDETPNGHSDEPKSEVVASPVVAPVEAKAVENTVEETKVVEKEKEIVQEKPVEAVEKHEEKTVKSPRKTQSTESVSPSTAEPIAEKPSSKATDDAPEASAPAFAAVAAQAEIANGTASPKRFRRQESSKPSKSSSNTPVSSPKTSSRSEKVEKSEKSEKSDKSERSEKSEKKADKSSSESPRPVSPTTAEKRTHMVTATSVKAIKETFEAKSKEEQAREQAEKEVTNARAARRKSMKLDDSGSGSGSKKVE